MQIFRKSSFFSFLRKNLFLVLLIVLASITYLTNLGGQAYSLDEALTVAVSKTILMYGYPTAWDGHIFLGGPDNIFTTYIHGIYFFTWYPWLQFYVLATFYYLFGNAIGILRVPFAIFGVATIVVFYFIVLELFKKKWIATLLAIQLIFLMPFFLYARQIHYYSPSAFCSVVLFYLLLRFAAGMFTKKDLMWFSIASLLLLMTNSLIWLGCLPVFILFCIVRTYKNHRFKLFSLDFVIAVFNKNKALILIILFEGFLTFLWFKIFAPFGGKNPVLAYGADRPNIFVGIKEFLSYGNNFIFPLIVFPLTVFSAWKIKKLTYLWILLLWIGSKLVIYSYLIIPHGRFLTDIMPVYLLFFGFIYYYFRKQWVLVSVLFLLTISTNILSLAPAYLLSAHQLRFRFYPYEFFTELTGAHPPAYLQISDYISKRAKPGDMFYSNYDMLEIYLYSHIPAFSATGCRRASGIPIDFTGQKKIRWYFFYENGEQSLNQDICFGPKWQKYMEAKYTKRVFPIKEPAYLINDPDIVNRQFPSIKIPPKAIIMYEKK